MLAKYRNFFLMALVVISPFVLFLGFFLFMPAEQIPLPPLPAVNGYGDLVEAGQMVADNTTGFDTMGRQDLSVVVSQNAAALALARSAMTNDCAVPLQFTNDYEDAHLKELAALKRLGQAFCAEGRLAEMDGRTNDAVHSYLDAIQLGANAAHGGALIDQLVGMAVEALGASCLQPIAGRLDAATAREAAAELETLDSQRQTWDEIIQQEQGWSQRAFPGIKYQIMRIMERGTLAKSLQLGERKYDVNEQKTRQLILALAARAYGLDKGKPPTSVNVLVPFYLQAVPQDPATGTNMVLSSD
jgi:hypothetical protein